MRLLMSTYAVALCRIGLVLTFMAGFVGFVSGQKAADRPPAGKKDRRPPRYRIGLKYHTVEAAPTLVVNITVKPRHFNHEDMVALAHQLDKDFRQEKKLEVIIFSDHRAAKHTVFNQESQTFKRDWVAMRGGYHLDRTTGEEYISFSPDPNEPRHEVRITLGVARPR